LEDADVEANLRLDRLEDLAQVIEVVTFPFDDVLLPADLTIFRMRRMTTSSPIV